jgi:HEAT repeat protein
MLKDLVTLLTDPDSARRRLALATVLVTPSPAARAAALRRLAAVAVGDHDAGVRQRAAVSLLEVGGWPAVTALRPVLQRGGAL